MTQLLRRLAFFLGRREDLHRAAGLLDCRDRGLRGAVHFDVELALNSPRPSNRRPPLARRSTPALTRDSTFTTLPASIFLASTASWSRSRLISANSMRKMLLKPRLGRRRCKGI